MIAIIRKTRSGRYSNLVLYAVTNRIILTEIRPECCRMTWPISHLDRLKIRNSNFLTFWPVGWRTKRPFDQRHSISQQVGALIQLAAIHPDMNLCSCRMEHTRRSIIRRLVRAHSTDSDPKERCTVGGVREMFHLGISTDGQHTHFPLVSAGTNR